MTSAGDRELRLFPEVEHDLSDTRDWYNERHPGLGNDFIDEFWQTVSLVLNYPKMSPIVHFGQSSEEIRRSHFVGRFPYGILHFLADDERNLVVVSVTHDRQHDDNWTVRLS